MRKRVCQQRSQGARGTGGKQIGTQQAMDPEQNIRRQPHATSSRLPHYEHAGTTARLTAGRGFTLVELMVTIVIISILAGIVLVAARAAQQAANQANTQALIAKLHGQLMIRYESYRTRRLPINTLVNTTQAGGVNLTAQQAALYRLNAVRELMRMELPDRYSDLMAYSSTFSLPNTYSLPSSPTIVPPYFSYDPSGPAWYKGTGNLTLQPTAVNISYQRKCNANAQRPTADFEDAECLYLILNTGLSDDTVAGELINPSNIGDVDGDGMPEFIDAWGRPIRFIRWAPGFVSDIQPYDPINNPNDPHLTAKNHDPFDPLKMQHPFPSANTFNDFQTGPANSNSTTYSYDGTHPWTTPDGKSLVPLIYSLGADGVDDIQHPPVDSNGYALASTSTSSSYPWYASFHNFLSQPGTFTPAIPAFPVYDPYIVTAPPGTPQPPNFLLLPVEQSWRAVPSSAPSFPNNWIPVGAPSDTDGNGDAGGWADNITNHLLGQQ